MQEQRNRMTLDFLASLAADCSAELLSALADDLAALQTKVLAALDTSRIAGVTAALQRLDFLPLPQLLRLVADYAANFAEDRKAALAQKGDETR